MLLVVINSDVGGLDGMAEGCVMQLKVKVNEKSCRRINLREKASRLVTKGG
jgi:hypothetical protein